MIAVLDCDHVPLPTFLTATLGWFDDDRVALVQGPQAFFNTGAFDDDGYSGEQGLFFNVLMPSRQAAGVGPFWCGSTSLLRVSALRRGRRRRHRDHHRRHAHDDQAAAPRVAHASTTTRRWRSGWPRRRPTSTCCSAAAGAWGRCRSWCTSGCGPRSVGCRGATSTSTSAGTLWWLEGVATIAAFAVPIAVLVSGAADLDRAAGGVRRSVLAMFALRLWGSKRSDAGPHPMVDGVRAAGVPRAGGAGLRVVARHQDSRCSSR